VTGEARELHSRDGAATGGLVEEMLSFDDLARVRQVRRTRKLNPLEVANDGELRRLAVGHGGQSHTIDRGSYLTSNSLMAAGEESERATVAELEGEGEDRPNGR
jgi:hypothetical protein